MGEGWAVTFASQVTESWSFVLVVVECSDMGRLPRPTSVSDRAMRCVQGVWVCEARTHTLATESQPWIPEPHGQHIRQCGTFERHASHSEPFKIPRAEAQRRSDVVVVGYGSMIRPTRAGQSLSTTTSSTHPLLSHPPPSPPTSLLPSHPPTPLPQSQGSSHLFLCSPFTLTSVPHSSSKSRAAMAASPGGSSPATRKGRPEATVRVKKNSIQRPLSCLRSRQMTSFLVRRDKEGSSVVGLFGITVCTVTSTCDPGSSSTSGFSKFSRMGTSIMPKF